MNVEETSAGPAALDRRVRVLQALGDPVRLEVVDLLRVRDLSPAALSAALEVPGNLLAHHLRVLEAAGVVERTASQHDRRRTYVHLHTSALLDLLPTIEPLAVPRVVFVCTHNSARSVLAEELWRAVSDVPAASAGTHPADRINPQARAAARRAGLAVSKAAPTRLADVLRPDDLVVSVCDAVNEELGDLPNARMHWSVPDPSRDGSAEAFGRAVADLDARVHELAPHVTRTRTPRRRRRT